MRGKLIAHALAVITTTAFVLTLSPATNASHDGLPDACGDGLNLALRHGSQIHGQAGSAAQLYKGKWDGEQHWFVSYKLETNDLTNGADKFAAYAEIKADYDEDPQGVAHPYTEYETFFEDGSTASGSCKEIGAVPSGGDITWWVQAGATGWETSSTFEYSIWAEVSVGIKISKFGAEAEGGVTLGGSLTWENGAQLDSEVLIGENSEGSSCPITGCEEEFWAVD